jgi:hypothetical protein
MADGVTTRAMKTRLLDEAFPLQAVPIGKTFAYKKGDQSLRSPLICSPVALLE